MLSLSISLFYYKKGAQPRVPPHQPPSFFTHSLPLSLLLFPLFKVILAKQHPPEPRPEPSVALDLLEGPARRGVPFPQGAAEALCPVAQLLELGLELGDPGPELFVDR